MVSQFWVKIDSSNGLAAIHYPNQYWLIVDLSARRKATKRLSKYTTLLANIVTADTLVRKNQVIGIQNNHSVLIVSHQVD